MPKFEIKDFLIVYQYLTKDGLSFPSNVVYQSGSYEGHLRSPDIKGLKEDLAECVGLDNPEHIIILNIIKLE